MNRSLIAQFILRLQDRTSAGLGAIQRRLQGLTQVARRLALVGGALAGLSVAGPIAQAAALEGQMRATAITAGLSGAAVEEMMARSLVMFQRVARETNQRVSDLAQAAGTLVAGGGRAGEVWEELVPIIGRVATASGANANDLSQSVLAVVNNLRLGPDQVEQALASMVQAGREGQFELKDMAREFAGLTAAAAGIGLTGPSAISSLSAALQVARQGAGSAGEAATNLTNILQKMTSPDAVRNFREMGVDLEAVMKDAGTRGINPLEALIQKIREVTGGDMFRVGELFADSQVLAFLRPMIQDTERYMAVRDRAAAASPSLIADGQEDAMRGLAAATQRVTVAWDEFTVRVGAASEGAIRMAGDVIFWLSDRIGALEAAFPGLTAQLGAGIAVITAAAIAITALGFAIGPLAAGIAILVSPIGLTVAAIATLAAAAWALWRNWEPIAAWFTGLWNDIRTGMQPQVDWLLDVLNGAGAIAVGLFRAAWDGLAGNFVGIWAAITAPFEAFGAWVSGWAAGPVAALVAAIMAPFAGLSGWFAALWSTMIAPFEGFISTITAGLERVRAVWDGMRSAFSSGQAAQATANAAPPALGGVQARQAAARGNPAGGFYAANDLAAATAGGAGAPPAPVNGEIIVRAAPGTEIVSAEGSNSNVPVTAAAQNRGGTRGRP